ncbi:hypothetical protein EW146_g1082 [Bondarzewia mesenterica]|uniref:Tubulin-tyrosine ligase n=1 Tax=Bondarzewia mesenterica TaxID=1095465 RepID=A0A4S4M511_9AGAM|nr:hypothetical protein EW146_g1082 [Bondarzewia mesenterica]
MSCYTAFISWPSAPLTESLVRKALLSLPSPFEAVSSPPQTFRKLLQWATYDDINHELTHASEHPVLSSSYIIRKALIRKHFLARCIHSYLVKHEAPMLRAAVPRTWDLEISFADELDDMWADDLWDLAQEMNSVEQGRGRRGKWWILKPGMADRGMGIRLFDSKEALVRIFEGFEEEEEEDEGWESEGKGEGRDDDTAVVTSQLRHFVIQVIPQYNLEYVSTPLLLDPYQVLLNGSTSRPFDKLQGHKFHLRAYCVAHGALKVYLYTRILALFSSKPYSVPEESSCNGGRGGSTVDLAPHLTNTSLQTHRGEEGVRLFDELMGCHILSCPNGGSTIDDDEEDRPVLTAMHLLKIQDQMADVLAETFKAALETPVHFQPLPNAFELYGIDFLVSHGPASPLLSEPNFQVKLLEINAEPAIELTGPRLTWILEDLFVAMGKVCVEPFVRDTPSGSHESWQVGETRHFLRKCLDSEVRGAGGW